MKPIGELIHDRLKEQELTVKEFAEAIGYQRSNAYRIFNQATIDTGLLMRIGFISIWLTAMEILKGSRQNVLSRVELLQESLIMDMYIWLNRR